MRVLVLSKYGALAASPRYRFLQYAPLLASHGIDLHFSPLLDDDYLTERLSNERIRPIAVLNGVARRLRDLLRAWRYDLLWIHCELLPFAPPWFEEALARLRIPYVFDFDDAIFHTYDLHPRRIVRTLLSDKIARIVRGAAAVTAGSPYLVEFALRHNPRVHLVPTVVDVQRYPLHEPEERSELTIGWIGSPSSSAYLEQLRTPLSRLSAAFPMRLVAVGSRPLDFPGVAVEVIEWSEESENEALRRFDLGVMPLPDAPWARGKCAFKLIQYMAAGLPVVASPVGMNVDVVAGSGFLAVDDDAWVGAISKLRQDLELRRSLGRSGRRQVEQKYSLASMAPEVTKILDSAAGTPQRL